MGEENHEPENKFETRVTRIVLFVAACVIIIKLIVIFTK
jgi:hypothetical protein